MDCGELVCGPDSKDNEKDEAGQIDGAASAKTGDAAEIDHRDVDEPHREGEEDLGVAEVGGADGGLGDERADEEACGHAREAEEESLEGDLVGGFERRKPGEGGGFLLEAALLNEVKE